MTSPTPSAGSPRTKPAAYPSGPLWTLRRVREDPLAFLDALAASGEDIVGFRLGGRQAFLLNHPALVDDVLARRPDVYVKGRGFARARRLLGDGLLTASEPLHAVRRRVIQPAFHRQQIASYARTVVEHAERLAGAWRPGAPIDVGKAMRGLTLGVIGETLFGADLAPRVQDVEEAVDAALPSMDGLIALVAPSRRVRRARQQLDAIVDEIIAGRRAMPHQPDDLLSLLLSASEDGGARSAVQLRDDVVTLLLAGHDTIAHALTWTWVSLAAHADVDTQLGVELARAANGPALSMDDMPRLDFARRVLAESLRLLPPAWVIVRWAAVDSRLGDVDVLAGSIVVASPYALHRNPRFFHDPLTFDPDRWLASDDPPSAARSKAFFPFGAGPRACIGEGFAWMEGTLALAVLARRWRLAPVTHGPVAGLPTITLRPAGPVMMTPLARSGS